MIKLPHDLYDHFINDYIALLLRKGFDKESFFELISKAGDHNEAYRIPDEQKEDFLRTVLVNPFSKETLKKYSLLNDYFQCIKNGDKNNPNQVINIIDSFMIPRGNKSLTLKDIFDYSGFISKTEKKKTLRVYIIEAAGVEVCPYCNRQYIDIFDKNNGESKAIAQLDHYYPKEKYPLYALSLYNLIPVCGSCNQGKAEEVGKVIYPFSRKANEENRAPYFKIKADDLDKLTGKVLPQIDYAFEQDDSGNRKKQHADFFYHKNMYQNHQRFAQRLLQAQKLDNQAYLDGMNKVLEKENLRLSKSELRELLYGFNGSDEELLQKPLSKLARDLIPSLKK